MAREVVVPAAKPGDVVVAGGLRGGDRSATRTYRLSLATGLRRGLPGLPVAVHDAAGASLGGHVLVLGGGNVTEQATVQDLSPSRARWRIMSRLPQPRSDLVAVHVGRSVVVLGGYDGVTSPADVLATSDGHSFRVVGRLAVAVRYPAVAVVHGVVWLFGGEQNSAVLGVVQRFDPRTGRTRVVGRLPRPTGHGAAVAVGDRVLLAGGRVGPDAVTAAMWEFDPESRRFRHMGMLPYPVADAGVASNGRVAYLLGGETPALTGKVIRIGGFTRYTQ